MHFKSCLWSDMSSIFRLSEAVGTQRAQKIIYLESFEGLQENVCNSYLRMGKPSTRLR